jgi:hypothetical protein
MGHDGLRPASCRKTSPNLLDHNHLVLTCLRWKSGSMACPSVWRSVALSWISPGATLAVPFRGRTQVEKQLPGFSYEPEALASAFLEATKACTRWRFLKLRSLSCGAATANSHERKPNATRYSGTAQAVRSFESSTLSSPDGLRRTAIQETRKSSAIGHKPVVGNESDTREPRNAQLQNWRFGLVTGN